MIPLTFLACFFCLAHSAGAQWELRFGGNLAKHTREMDLQFLAGLDHFPTDRTSFGFDVVIDPPGVILGKSLKIAGREESFKLDQHYYGIHYRSSYYFSDYDRMGSVYLSSILGIGAMTQSLIIESGYTSYSGYSSSSRKFHSATSPLATLGLRFGLRAAQIMSTHIYLGGGISVPGRSNLSYRSTRRNEQFSPVYFEVGYVIGGAW